MLFLVLDYKVDGAAQCSINSIIYIILLQEILSDWMENDFESDFEPCSAVGVKQYGFQKQLISRIYTE